MESIEALSGCVDGAVRILKGSDGVTVVCQERHEHNFDLSHENWGDIERGEEQIVGGSVLITGDKACGKTTFLAGLTSGSPQILQVCKYDTSAFYNIWYGVGPHEAETLQKSLENRRLGYYQTELAHGSLLVPSSEYGLFLEDEEYCVEKEDVNTAKDIQRELHGTEHVFLRLVEVGADALQNLDSPPDDKKIIYNSIAKMVDPARLLCYFLDDQGAVEAKLSSLKRRLFVKNLAIFTRFDTVMLNAETILKIAANLGYNARIYRCEHLHPDMSFDYQGILKTFHRMALSCGIDPNGLHTSVITEFVCGLILKSGFKQISKSLFRQLLDDFSEELEHGHTYNEAAQPFVAFPPAYLTTTYDAVMLALSERGFLLPPKTRLILYKDAETVMWECVTPDDTFTLPTSSHLLTLLGERLALGLTAAPKHETHEYPCATVQNILLECKATSVFIDLFIVAGFLQTASLTDDETGNVLRLERTG